MYKSIKMAHVRYLLRNIDRHICLEEEGINRLLQQGDNLVSNKELKMLRIKLKWNRQSHDYLNFVSDLGIKYIKTHDYPGRYHAKRMEIYLLTGVDIFRCKLTTVEE